MRWFFIRREIHTPLMSNDIYPNDKVRIYRIPAAGDLKLSSHQFRKKSMNPHPSRMPIFFHVTKLSLMPLVPMHDSARNSTAKILV